MLEIIPDIGANTAAPSFTCISIPLLLFKQKGIFNRDVAGSFRQNILSKGGTEHPMTLYKRFRGQEPTIDALLIRNGIKN